MGAILTTRFCWKHTKNLGLLVLNTVNLDNMDTGYIKLWRKSLESPVFQNPNLWYFWCWCLVKATYKPRKVKVGYKTISLQPGEFIFGRNKASEEIGLSVQTIRTCIKHLENDENLTIKSTKTYSIISINNWDTYQSKEDSSNQQDNQELTKSQPRANHKQESKECKEVKNRTTNVVLARSQNGNGSGLPESVLQIPLISGQIFLVTQEDIDQWQDTFPAVDVKHAIGLVRQWNLDNPTKRKTPKGIRKHITTWLSKEQDKGGGIFKKADQKLSEYFGE
jgi:hypothetical protein